MEFIPSRVRATPDLLRRSEAAIATAEGRPQRSTWGKSRWKSWLICGVFWRSLRLQIDFPRKRLVQPEASSPPFAARALANLPRISCTTINKLLVRLIRGKSCQRQQQNGSGLPAGRTGSLQSDEFAIQRRDLPRGSDDQHFRLGNPKAKASAQLFSAVETGQTRAGVQPFQCRAQRSVKSRRDVASSMWILPSSLSITSLLPSSCKPRRPMSSASILLGGADLMASK